MLLSLPVTSYLFLFIHFQTSIMKHNLYFHFFTNSLLFKSHLPFYSSSKNCFVKVHKYRLFSLQFLSFFPLTLWSPFYLKLVPLFRFTIQCYLTWSYFSTPFLPLHFWIIFPLLSTHSRSWASLFLLIISHVLSLEKSYHSHDNCLSYLSNYPNCSHQLPVTYLPMKNLVFT